MKLKKKISTEFDSGTEWWQSDYENLDFKTIDTMWQQVQPLYNELHKYVRRKLSGIYGATMDQYAPYMPAHVTGNMWAQTWTNLYDRVRPFNIDDGLGGVTEAMRTKSYTVPQMFQEADHFFQSMGLPEQSMSYGPKAIVTEPTDRSFTCHASAWDFCKNNDYRIKMCTALNFEDFVTVHHEMGHIQYYIQYAHQPLQLRGGANPAFHEAVGDVIALSFSNPKYLHKVSTTRIRPEMVGCVLR